MTIGVPTSSNDTGRPTPGKAPTPAALVSENRLDRDFETIERLANDGPLAGFDQLMWLSPAREPGSALAYRVFNADGSEVEQCGNGVRCVASLLLADEGDLLAFPRLIRLGVGDGTHGETERDGDGRDAW